MTKNQSETLTEAPGWTLVKGHLADSWEKDGDRVWRASARRQWVRAAYDGTRFSHHRSFDKFDDAIADRDGEKFGPNWKSEKSNQPQ